LIIEGLLLIKAETAMLTAIGVNGHKDLIDHGLVRMLKLDEDYSALWKRPQVSGSSPHYLKL
jgi:hypothetical protein